MKASEVIVKLQLAVDRYGDLPLVDLNAKTGIGSVWTITPLDDMGVEIPFSKKDEPVELFLESQNYA